MILFTTFRSSALAALILGNIPFALVGGVVALFISGQYLSVPASVGFIALLGIAVLNGVVMVSWFEQSRTQYPDAPTRVVSGAIKRLRPILMTATTAMFGLMPLVFATGPRSPSRAAPGGSDAGAGRARFPARQAGRLPDGK